MDDTKGKQKSRNGGKEEAIEVLDGKQMRKVKEREQEVEEPDVREGWQEQGEEERVKEIKKGESGRDGGEGALYEAVHESFKSTLFRTPRRCCLTVGPSVPSLTRGSDDP